MNLYIALPFDHDAISVHNETHRFLVHSVWTVHNQRSGLCPVGNWRTRVDLSSLHMQVESVQKTKYVY